MKLKSGDRVKIISYPNRTSGLIGCLGTVNSVDNDTIFLYEVRVDNRCTMLFLEDEVEKYPDEKN